MKKAMNSIKKMSFETKGFEAKIGRTMFTRRPYAKVTVSEDMIYLGTAVTVGVPLVVTGAKQIVKALGAGKRKIDSIIASKQSAAAEDFMEQ